MKTILIIIFAIISKVVIAQEKKQVDSLNFCSLKYKVPVNCTAESEYQISCNDYTMSWLYMNDEMFRGNLPEQFISQIETGLKDVKKVPLKVYILKKPAKGYEISFKTDDGIRYRILAYAVVNNQPVLIQLSLNNEPKTNEDIPDFPRQIMSLTN